MFCVFSLVVFSTMAENVLEGGVALPSRAAALGGGPTVGGLGEAGLEEVDDFESSRACPSRRSSDAILISRPGNYI